MQLTKTSKSAFRNFGSVQNLLKMNVHKLNLIYIIVKICTYYYTLHDILLDQSSNAQKEVTSISVLVVAFCSLCALMSRLILLTFCCCLPPFT